MLVLLILLRIALLSIEITYHDLPTFDNKAIYIVINIIVIGLLIGHNIYVNSIARGKQNIFRKKISWHLLEQHAKKGEFNEFLINLGRASCFHKIDHNKYNKIYHQYRRKNPNALRSQLLKNLKEDQESF